MRATDFLVFGAVVLFAVTGCGPMTSPMPVRLSVDEQENINNAWDKALTPIGKLDRQAVLDLMVLRYAFEVGVDKLDFRSEKLFKGGKVVMMIAFDRAKPELDRFDFTVFDEAGKEVRTERYSRDDIELANRVFYRQNRILQEKKGQGTATASELKELGEIEARIRAVNAAYPAVQIVPPELRADDHK
ncbi:MAG TPA: hypothetical protein VGJ05_01750 [Fimbriiglobus sp.]